MQSPPEKKPDIDPSPQKEKTVPVLPEVHPTTGLPEIQPLPPETDPAKLPDFEPAREGENSAK